MAWDDFGGEQPSGWNATETNTALSNPSWQQPEGSGGGWQSALRGGFQGLMGALPNVAGAAAGYGFNALMPGKTSLIDARNPQQRAVSSMNTQRLSDLQANPTSFGLPGDPNDPNSPAGKKRYDIINASRNADAARGMFTTGGSAQRESNALNTAVGNEYNNIFNQSSQHAMAGPGMSLQQHNNPWAQLFSGIASPAVSGITKGILNQFGLNNG